MTSGHKTFTISDFPVWAKSPAKDEMLYIDFWCFALSFKKCYSLNFLYTSTHKLTYKKVHWLDIIKMHRLRHTASVERKSFLQHIDFKGLETWESTDNKKMNRRVKTDLHLYLNIHKQILNTGRGPAEGRRPWFLILVYGLRWYSLSWWRRCRGWSLHGSKRGLKRCAYTSKGWYIERCWIEVRLSYNPQDLILHALKQMPTFTGFTISWYSTTSYRATIHKRACGKHLHSDHNGLWRLNNEKVYVSS